MLKYILIIALFFIATCNRPIDYNNVYEVMESKYPNDEFIKKTLDKLKKQVENDKDSSH